MAEPMGVVDHAEHEVLLGRGRQQRQGRHAHQEAAPPTARRPLPAPLAGPGPEGRFYAQPGQWQQQTMERREAKRLHPPVPACATPSRPRPCGRASSSRADFPTPGSPRTTRQPAVPCRACSTSASRRARSGSRPTSTPRTYTLADHRSRLNQSGRPRPRPARLQTRPGLLCTGRSRPTPRRRQEYRHARPHLHLTPGR